MCNCFGILLFHGRRKYSMATTPNPQLAHNTSELPERSRRAHSPQQKPRAGTGTVIGASTATTQHNLSSTILCIDGVGAYDVWHDQNAQQQGGCSSLHAIEQSFLHADRFTRYCMREYRMNKKMYIYMCVLCCILSRVCMFVNCYSRLFVEILKLILSSDQWTPEPIHRQINKTRESRKKFSRQ